MGFQHLDTSFAYADMRVLFSQDLSIIETAFEGYCPLSGGDVVAGTTTGKVKVNAGTDLNGGTEVTVAAQDNLTVTADASLARFAYVEVDNAGTATVNHGTAAASPVPPTPTAARVVHALLYIPANTTGTVCDALLTTANGNKKIIDRRCLRTSMDVQVFLTAGSFTWTKMPGVRYVYVRCIAGGGGGGSGSRVANITTAAHGGAGGGPGGISDGWIPAALLGSTEAVVVGAGGAGGTAVSTNANGNPGTNGVDSSFGTNLVVEATHGVGGGGGVTAGAAGGAGGGGTLSGIQSASRLATAASTAFTLGTRKGGTGATGTTPAAAVAGAQDELGAGAGGGGGGNSAASALQAAAQGGSGTSPVAAFGIANVGGQVANATAGTTGGAGTGQGANYLGIVMGGGGGAGGNGHNVAAGVGGTGGAGAKFGGGGGGGGNGISAGSSGPGGVGADGAVLVLGFA